MFCKTSNGWAQHEIKFQPCNPCEKLDEYVYNEAYYDSSSYSDAYAYRYDPYDINNGGPRSKRNEQLNETVLNELYIDTNFHCPTSRTFSKRPCALTGTFTAIRQFQTFILASAAVPMNPLLPNTSRSNYNLRKAAKICKKAKKKGFSESFLTSHIRKHTNQFKNKQLYWTVIEGHQMKPQLIRINLEADDRFDVLQNSSDLAASKHKEKFK